MLTINDDWIPLEMLMVNEQLMLQWLNKCKKSFPITVRCFHICVNIFYLLFSYVFCVKKMNSLKFFTLITNFLISYKVFLEDFNVIRKVNVTFQNFKFGCDRKRWYKVVLVLLRMIYFKSFKRLSYSLKCKLTKFLSYCFLLRQADSCYFLHSNVTGINIWLHLLLLY